MARTPAAAKKQKTFKQTLWETADKLRGSVEKNNKSRKGALPMLGVLDGVD